MSRRTFLVTGATGDTGGATVEQIVARGHHVRALAHRQDDRAKRLQGLGAEVVCGDFLNLDDVRAALRGVAGAYFCYPIRPGIIQATAFFAQAAKEAGVACVVNMSQISAREDAKSHAAITAEDQARVIVGILENPSPHGGKAYPLYGPVEFTYQGIANVLSHLLGKEVQYKQVSIETMLQMMASGGQKPPAGHNARALYGEFEQAPDRRAGDSFVIQHLREVAIDHQNGVFAGTNNLVETIGGRPATTLEAFVDKHRAAFA